MEQTKLVNADLYKAMVFFIEGLAFMGTLKVDHPEAHAEVIKLARMIDADRAGDESANVYSRHPHRSA